MLVRADYARTPQENIDDGISRRIEFRALDGEFCYRHNGQIFTHRFSDNLDEKHQALTLRTAIKSGYPYYYELIELGNKAHSDILVEHPTAKMLVIADDKIHAETIAEDFRKKYSKRVIVLTEETPQPAEALRRYKNGEADVLVAVYMMTEGINADGARIGIYLTKKTARLFFEQTMHRLSRKEKLSQKGPGIWLGPADARIIEQVKQLEGLNLVTVEKPSDPSFDKNKSNTSSAGMGTFVPISAVAQEITGICGDLVADHYQLKKARALRQTDPQLYSNIGDVQLSQIAQKLAPEPVLPAFERIETYDEARKRLKRAASDLANKLARERGVEPREVHREWIFGGNDRHEDSDNQALEEKINWLSSELEHEQAILNEN